MPDRQVSARVTIKLRRANATVEQAIRDGLVGKTLVRRNTRGVEIARNAITETRTTAATIEGGR